MKRPTREQRLRHIRRSRRQMKLRRRRRYHGALYSNLRARAVPQTVSPSRRRRFRTVVSLEGDLSLIRRTVPTARMLSRLDLRLPYHDGASRLMVDMAGVTALDAPSLLYVAATIDLAPSRNFAGVGGTYPVSPMPKRTMRDANFEAFLGGSSLPTGSRKTLDLVRGGSTDATKQEIAIRMKRFLDKCAVFSVEESDQFYVAVMEGLENVAHHAYRGTRAPKRDAWYVVGLWDEPTRTASIAVADAGIGIVQSVALRIPERLRRAFKGARDYLREATTGALTRTREQKRGKGLRTLREFATSAPGRWLHVFSSGASITWYKDPVAGVSEQTRSTVRLGGTIVCLEIQATATGSE